MFADYTVDNCAFVAAVKADAYSAVAMENAYYICHNVSDFLQCRGFKWAGAGKKKKGKKK